MPTRAVIVDAVRSPMAAASPPVRWRPHPADLLAQALSALVDRSSLDPALWTTSSLAAWAGQASSRRRQAGRRCSRPAGRRRRRRRRSSGSAARSAGGGVRRGRHRCRPVRHRGRRWRESMSRHRWVRRGWARIRSASACGSDSRSSCRRASRPSSSRNASASAAYSWTNTPRARTRGRNRPASTAGSRTRSPPSSPVVRR